MACKALKHERTLKYQKDQCICSHSQRDIKCEGAEGFHFCICDRGWDGRKCLSDKHNCTCNKSLEQCKSDYHYCICLEGLIELCRSSQGDHSCVCPLEACKSIHHHCFCSGKACNCVIINKIHKLDGYIKSSSCKAIKHECRCPKDDCLSAEHCCHCPMGFQDKCRANEHKCLCVFH